MKRIYFFYKKSILLREGLLIKTLQYEEESVEITIWQLCTFRQFTLCFLK